MKVGDLDQVCIVLCLMRGSGDTVVEVFLAAVHSPMMRVIIVPKDEIDKWFGKDEAKELAHSRGFEAPKVVSVKHGGSSVQYYNILRKAGHGGEI